jgi:AraC-like DNA-binding protein
MPFAAFLSRAPRALGELREKLGEKCLGESYSVERIAYMLGLSDSSAFRMAFKKWTGKTPREFREENR